MSSIDEIRDARIAKLELLKEKGVNPYPAESKRELSLAEAIATFEILEKEASVKWISGRIMSIRGQGAIVFITLNDGTGTFQGLLKKDILGDEKLEFFSAVVDIGDFVEIQGKFFTTKRGEKTLEATDWRMLSKSLRPLPEKWHGLVDVEERFRKRYLDALMSSEVKDRFIVRSKIITELRKILDGNGYLEVETPALQPLYGGASAEPFVTHHNAQDMKMYLRISDELYLKRMLVAGFPKVYEIARDFRNEGIDMTHNPEFTMVEFYESYGNSTTQMNFVEKIFQTLVKEIKNTDTLEYNGININFSKKFEVIAYYDLFKQYASIDPENISKEDLEKEAKKLGVQVGEGDSIPKILDIIYKKMCRPKLVQPTFVIDYPVEYLPLAKRLVDNPKFVGAFQLVIGGIELVKAFSELNDPLDQRARFEEQEENKKGGEVDAQRKDEDFLEAMEYGMPPAGGTGIGIDRLVMFLTNTQNIKEVIFFPTMKPKDSEEKSSKEMEIVTAIINDGVKLEQWQILNTIAHLSAAFGARSKKKLFKFDSIKTGDDKNIKLNIRHAIMIKKAESSEAIWKLSDRAQADGLEIAHFTREMIETTNDNKVMENTKAKNQKDIDFLGLLVFGPKSKVEELTADLKLY